jgi:hypothetical protein
MRGYGLKQSHGYNEANSGPILLQIVHSDRRLQEEAKSKLEYRMRISFCVSHDVCRKNVSFFNQPADKFAPPQLASSPPTHTLLAVPNAMIAARMIIVVPAFGAKL